MPREGTKAAEIMRLDAEGLSTREIAQRVNCSTAYVRVVARQRIGGSMSSADHKYRVSDKGRDCDRRSRKRRSRQKSAYDRTLAKTGNHQLARQAYRDAKEAANA